jgi:hypothetical protein
MNEADQQQLTDYWDRETRYVNEKIDDSFKLAQDHAYELGLKRGMASGIVTVNPNVYAFAEISRQLQSWLDWHQEAFEVEGVKYGVNDDCHLFTLPGPINRGMLKAWISVLQTIRSI